MVFAHTAQCGNCKALLYHPYPNQDYPALIDKDAIHAASLNWILRSSFSRHDAFRRMLKFSIDEALVGEELKILDYGGGPGQFALVCHSLFPLAKVYYTDAIEGSLLDP